MKKLGIVFATLVLTLVVSGCSNQKESNNVKEIPKSDVTVQEQSNITKRDVREVVWDQLTSKDKERVEGTWPNSEALVENKFVFLSPVTVRKIQFLRYLAKVVSL